MRRAFFFLSRNPKVTVRAFRRFYDDVAKSGEPIDFFVISYIDQAPAGSAQEVIDGRHFTHLTYGREAILTLPYPGKTAPYPGKDHWTLIPGNADLPLLAAWRDLPKYDQYWTAEDDLMFTGNVVTMIEDLSQQPADLWCCHVINFLKGWDYEASFRKKKDDDWISALISTDVLLCFLPFFGITKRGLDILDAAYQSGWAGHHEVAWPSLIRGGGGVVFDIGGSNPSVTDKMRNRYYVGRWQSGMKDGTMRSTPARLRPGRRRNTLYHPVKPWRDWVTSRRKRIISITRYYLIKLTIIR